MNTYTRALQVIPSPYAAIPTPNVVRSGSTSAVGASPVGGFIEVAGYDFPQLFADNVLGPGDVVYFYNDFIAFELLQPLGIANPERVLVNMDLSVYGPSFDFKIYANSPKTTLPNQGCSIYSNTDGNPVYNIHLASGDIIGSYAYPLIMSLGVIYDISAVKIEVAGDYTNLWALW